jgi:hypothetical protein
MFRKLLVVLLVGGLAATGLCTIAQERQPKGLPRIAIADPAKAKEDPDFAVQGEYEGEVAGDEYGVQVIALGAGKFDIAVYRGGLPGTVGTERVENRSAAREGNKVIVTDSELGQIGEILDGRIEVQTAEFEGTLKKVDRKSPTLGMKPPEGAVVLFAGPGDEKNWDRGKLVELSDGTFLTVDRAGDLRSKRAFGAFKAHIEFRLPWMPNSRGQGRGNSGVYVQDRYEIQVLDSFGLQGRNNECGGIYQQYDPLVNMCLPPLAWQTFDIEFTPAEFDGDKRVKPARLTLLHNGVKIHDNVELRGPTGGGADEKPTPGPFRLQDHGDPVVYRNIWVLEKK